jgi:hypothetical protein
MCKMSKRKTEWSPEEERPVEPKKKLQGAEGNWQKSRCQRPREEGLLKERAVHNMDHILIKKM